MIEVWFARAESPRRNGSAGVLARIVLGSLLGVPPAQVPIRRRCRRCGSTEHGKPYVAGAPIHFSTSSAGGRVAVAAGEVPLGVDLVDVAEIRPETAGAILSPAEQADDPRGLATVWARKEAILKATGDGLSVDPQAVRVSAPDAPAALLSWPLGGVRGVHVVDLDTGSQVGSVSSLAWLSGAGMRVAVHPDATALMEGER